MHKQIETTLKNMNVKCKMQNIEKKNTHKHREEKKAAEKKNNLNNSVTLSAGKANKMTYTRKTRKKQREKRERNSKYSHRTR